MVLLADDDDDDDSSTTLDFGLSMNDGVHANAKVLGIGKREGDWDWGWHVVHSHAQRDGREALDRVAGRRHSRRPFLVAALLAEPGHFVVGRSWTVDGMGSEGGLGRLMRMLLCDLIWMG